MNLYDDNLAFHDIRMITYVIEINIQFAIACILGIQDFLSTLCIRCMHKNVGHGHSIAFIASSKAPIFLM